MNVIRLQNVDSSAAKPTGSIAGFDLLRAGAALAVVLLHACVPYLRHPMPGLIWAVTDTKSNLVDVIFWGIEIFIMPLFLVIAGFLLWRSAQRSSLTRLVRTRAKRLLIPLAFGVLVILPIDLYLWTVGLVSEGIVPIAKLKSLKFDSPIADHIWGLSHLWFLLYVFLYVVVTALLLRLSTGRSETTFARLAARPLVGIGMLATIAIVTLVAAPEVVWGFQHAFLPVPSKWIYSGVFFAGGYLLAMHDGQLRWTTRVAPRMCALAGMLLCMSLTIGVWTLDRQTSGQPIRLSANVLLSILTVAAASTTVLGLVGACARNVRRVPGVIRYLAAASFWIYLVHHPLLGLLHLDLKWAWPDTSPLVKLAVSFAVSTLVSLLLYETAVRRTAVGRLLGFAYQSDSEKLASTGEKQDTPTIPHPAIDSEERRAA
ncbi:acyltransferase [Stieleria sp. TO1_6]|uniref:acyltransferase family protein n=1 Tax=Stieleria tagensis TaxID=2956795 RepID=UPI00209AE687|nr:acyltransferase [Stieleria tagensis]MCO8122758.1 acyltransferase [Stieleria tagensis]